MMQGLAVFSDRLREPHALRCDTEAEQMDGQRLPDCHPVLGALFNNLSLLYHHMGRLRPAVFCMQRAVHVRSESQRQTPFPPWCYPSQTHITDPRTCQASPRPSLRA